MERFSAVATTGIYCRPGCPARPDPANVRRFDLAAAAEAHGYRACLRCRPYRAPQPATIEGPELVCRAVQLITTGALDGATEALLCARLGVSARHLRRLFQLHLGVTPDQLARSRRAHFARRLLDDTDLTITDIAFAAGYGTVRQLNRECRSIFQAPPRELRGRRRHADRLAADGGIALRLAFDGPLDLDAMLGYFATRAIPGVEAVVDGSYRRTIVVDGDPGVLELRAGETEEELLLRLHLPHWQGLIHLVDQARRIFALDAPVAAAVGSLAADPIVGPLVAASPGRRVPGTWDPFETGVRAIVGQQVSVAGASTVTGRIVERLGDAVPGLGELGLSRTFPRPAVLADADLTGLGLTAARADAVRGFARAVDDGVLPLDRGASLDELVGAITALRGLGPWTAHYLALRMGERDAFPSGDLGLQRAAASLGSGAGSLDDVARAWSPWRATAAVHLWARASGDAMCPTGAVRVTGTGQR